MGDREKLALAVQEEVPPALKTVTEEGNATVLVKEPASSPAMVLTAEERARVVSTWEADSIFAPELSVPDKSAQRTQLSNAILDLREAFASGKDMASTAKAIADLSTHAEGTNNRVVLGKWDENGGGYVGEAKKNGGIWYETSKGVFEKLAEGLSREEANTVAWSINERFLIEQMKRAVMRIDLVGETIDMVKDLRRESFTAMEINFLEKENSSYRLSGNSWVKVK